MSNTLKHIEIYCCFRFCSGTMPFASSAALGSLREFIVRYAGDGVVKVTDLQELLPRCILPRMPACQAALRRQFGFSSQHNHRPTTPLVVISFPAKLSYWFLNQFGLNRMGRGWESGGRGGGQRDISCQLHCSPRAIARVSLCKCVSGV